MIKGVIFDMDGVLIDAKEWHYEALNKALRLFGFEINHNDHINQFDGLPTKKKLEIISSVSNLPISLHQFINSLKQIYTMEFVYNRCKPNFLHENAIRNLKKDNYKIGLASNSVRDSVNLMLKKACLIEYFDIILSNEDVENPKPDPEIYQVAIGRLGLKPSEVLVIEDNINGIDSAKSAGAHLLVVKNVNEVNIDNIRKKITMLNAI